MACKIDQGLTRGRCDAFAFGGVARLLIGNKEDYVASGIFTIADGTTETCAGETAPEGMITEVANPTGVAFFEFDYEKDTASYTEELQTGGANTYINQTVQFTISSIQAEEVDFLEQFSLGNYICAVQRADGGCFMLGLDSGEGIKAETIVNSSGATKDDEAAAVITLTGGNLGYATPVCIDTMDELIVAGA